MAGNIKFSPEEGREMANVILQKRGAIEGEIEDLSGLILNDLCGNWEGSASEKYSSEYTNLKGQVMDKFLAMLDDLSAQLNSIADAMQSADEDIASKISMQ